jgi:MFS family permease
VDRRATTVGGQQHCRPGDLATNRPTREILLSAGLRFSEQMPFYLFTTFVLIYVVSRHGFSKTFVLNAVLVGALCELVAIPFFSQLSDRLGRKRVYLTGAVLTALIASRTSRC